MKIFLRLPATAALAAAITLAGACSKEASSTTSATQPVEATDTNAPSVDTLTASTSEAELQPTPGSPVVTVTPSEAGPAPMLPTLGSIPPASDEHSQTPDKAAVRRIAPEEAAMLLQTGEAVLVDVRSKDAFDGGHIRGAINLPYAEVGARARAELPPTRWIIPYCT